MVFKGVRESIGRPCSPSSAVLSPIGAAGSLDRLHGLYSRLGVVVVRRLAGRSVLA